MSGATTSDKDFINGNATLVTLSRRIEDAAQGEYVQVRNLVSAIGERSVLPLLLVPAMIAATPLSGIPGLTSLCGLTIALISAEMLMRADHVWLPDRIMRARADAGRVRQAMQKVRPWLNWLDGHTRNRLSFLFHRPVIFVPQVLCLLTGLAMPFLEIVPFSGSIASIGVTLLALSMLTRDGLFFLLALAAYGALGWAIWSFIG